MPGHKNLRLKHAAVICLAFVLALVSIGLVTALHSRATSKRDAELSLSQVTTSLNGLVEIAFSANPAQGGSPTAARVKLQSSQAAIDAALRRLRNAQPNSWLDRVSTPLRAEYALLEQIRVLDGEGDMPAALALGAPVERELARATAMLRSASADYERGASSALAQATAGSAAVIFILLGGFALFYRRSWVLLARNQHLLSHSRVEALTDVLTGLGNRRSFMARLDEVMPTARDGSRRWVLVLLDLDGFKHYNDSFGHPAGDALLSRLAGRLSETVAGIGTAYRMGGDEFCVLAEVEEGEGEGIARLAAAALSEGGESFHVTCSFGLALLPAEAASPEAALGLADRRMYAQKGAGRVSAKRQTADVLLRVLRERDPDLEEHHDDVGRLAQQLSERVGLPADAVDRIRLAAELHDVGKTAIPDSILNKPGTLDEAEWEFMRRHTLIGERIVLAAPALARTAPLVRSSHERYDGAGYPDRLDGRPDPAGLADHRDLRRLRRDGLRASVPLRDDHDRSDGRAAPLFRDAVRSRADRGLRDVRRGPSAAGRGLVVSRRAPSAGAWAAPLDLRAPRRHGPRAPPRSAHTCGARSALLRRPCGRAPSAALRGSDGARRPTA